MNKKIDGRLSSGNDNMRSNSSSTTVNNMVIIAKLFSSFPSYCHHCEFIGIIAEQIGIIAEHIGIIAKHICTFSKLITSMCVQPLALIYSIIWVSLPNLIGITSSVFRLELPIEWLCQLNGCANVLFPRPPFVRCPYWLIMAPFPVEGTI